MRTPNVIEILSTIQTALGISKQIRDLADNVATAELKLAIANLTEQLAEIKLQAVDLAEKNRELLAKIEKLSKPPELQFRENAYFKVNGDGPFCPSCHDSQSQLCRMTEVQGPERRMLHVRFKCPVCNATIN